MYCGINHLSIENLGACRNGMRLCSENAAIALDASMLAQGEPVQADVNLLLWCRRGCARLRIDLDNHDINAGEIVIVPEHSVVGGFMPSSDFDCVTIMFTTSLAHTLLNDKIYLWESILLLHSHRIVKLTEADTALVEHYATLLSLKIDNQRRDTYYPKSMNLVFSTLFLELLHIFIQAYPESKTNADFSREDMLFTRFITCIWNRDIKRLSVKAYADMLCVSSKYLTTVCRGQSNHSAQFWIKSLVKRDIGIYFTYTNLAIADVARFTGFQNASFFCKFFRRYFSTTPTQFRLLNQSRVI